MILFVSGFNRSGTTVLQESVAAATGGAPLTVRDLIQHSSPALAGRLRRIVESLTPVDRGVDSRPVTGDTPEEYGWLLLDRCPSGPRFSTEAVPVLRKVADEITERSGTAVLKNPSDTGLEAELLNRFPDSRVIVVRRGLAAIADSSCRAMARLVTSPAYVLALAGDSRWVRFLLMMNTKPAGAALVRLGTRWALRIRLVGFLRKVDRLPVDKVAFLDYDELVADPEGGSWWASHLLDAERLGKEFRSAHSHPRSPHPPGIALIDRYLDRRWARTWDRKRREQIRRRIVGA